MINKLNKSTSHLTSQNKHHSNSSQSQISKNSSQQQSICKLKIKLEAQQFSISIYSKSTIKQLALKLIVKLYDSLLQEQFNQEFHQIHKQICLILVNEIQSIIKIHQNQKQKKFLVKMIKDYQAQKSPIELQKQKQHKKKYFIKNYLSSMKQNSKNDISILVQRDLQAKQQSKKQIKLYEQAKKSREKIKKLQTENFQSKSKLQISYCTFHPNINKSQKKIKSKEKFSVFDRLYEDASQIRMKNLFKKKQIENQEQIRERSFKFIPEINQCSKDIIKLKQKHQKSDFDKFCNFNNKSTKNFIQNSYITSSQPYLKRNFSNNKLFENLCDSNFYENRLNKTIKKLNLEKQDSCSFQPQLSQGTKRMTKNYPKFQKRMRVYQVKNSQKKRSSPCFSTSKQKSVKNLQKNKIKLKDNHYNNKQNENFALLNKSKQKKGVKNFLARIKTQPLQDSSNSFCNGKNTSSYLEKYKSQIFKVQSSFIQDESMYQITPKKLNLQKDTKFLDKNKNGRNFFKSDEIFENKSQKGKTKDYAQKQNFQQSIHDQIQKIQNKQQIFIKIFQLLLINSSNGQILSSHITKNNQIPSQIKQLFHPLTNQLQDMNTSLDKDQFIWSLQNLYQQLDLQMKAILLAWGIRLFQKDNSFSKKINKNDKVPKVKNHNIKQSSHFFNQSNQLKHIKTQDSVFQLIQ